MAKLGECFSVIRNGASIRQTDGAGGFPITRIETIADKTINREKFGYAEIYDLAQYRDYILQDGDILMSHINSEKHLGKVALYSKQDDEQIIHGMNLLMLRADTQKVIPEYAKYYFESQKFLRQIGRITKKSVNQASFTVTALKKLEIPLASIIVQRDISEKLKKVDWLVSLRKQQLAKLDELIKVRFVEMFGEPVQNPNCWKTENLLDLGYCKNGMNFHRDDCGTEIHCLGVGDFKNHSTIRDVGSLPFISLNELPTSEYLLQDGDIVFVRSNGNKELVGRCLAIYPAKIPVTYSGFCIRYRLTSNKITVSYLLRVLKADSVRKKMMGRGANIQNLNQQILAQLVVPIPPLSLQNQFAAFVERVDQQKQTVQQSLEKLELMKKALMQEYFG